MMSQFACNLYIRTLEVGAILGFRLSMELHTCMTDSIRSTCCIFKPRNLIWPLTPRTFWLLPASHDVSVCLSSLHKDPGVRGLFVFQLSMERARAARECHRRACIKAGRKFLNETAHDVSVCCNLYIRTLEFEAILGSGSQWTNTLA